MVASFRGGGLDTGEEEGGDDDGSAQIIQDLLMQGANISATTDRTGETSLHLAARNARADAAKRLLEAGADANMPDASGRTPLHASIAADAQGVFQILLRNRATNLNARTNDGTTPLILAARLAIEGMVEDLIGAEADVNATDEAGKSALHWAAAVNNVDAVRILLAHGANRDAQDNKDETPLFLAAREGSYEACQVLLDHMANRDIGDHMDRLPRDVAQERMHHDIVRLLDEHVVRASHPPAAATLHPQLLHPHTTTLPPARPPKPKKRVKSGPGTQVTSPQSEGCLLKRKGSTKGKVEKKEEDSPIANTPMSPYEMNGNPLFLGVHNGLGMSHPNLASLSHLSQVQHQQVQQLPSYEEAIKNATIHSLALEPGSAFSNIPPEHMFSGISHIRQGSMPPLSMAQMHPQFTFVPGLPPHLMQHQHLHHSHHIPQQQPHPQPPPKPQQQPQGQQPTSQHGAIGPHQPSLLLSPPQSAGSSHTLSPPHPPLPSPLKTRPPGTSLPTSPTHMAAMRKGIYMQYPTPPSNEGTTPPPATPHGGQAGNAGMHPTTLPDTYLTPSPDPNSPDQWSSSSPHSQSDWSEPGQSPAYAGLANQTMMQGNQAHRQAEAVYI
ncbi:unnamed protein product [Darwinula stevensoni]|nr:unnamed protein product [Darwinula stevensoni]CAG0889382.1 unnamed protein product [Darwinula stevensoni]